MADAAAGHAGRLRPRHRHHAFRQVSAHFARYIYAYMTFEPSTLSSFKTLTEPANLTEILS